MADNQSNDRGSVVVTGTSTGIGAATVSRLTSLGFHVFAGVRHKEDAEGAQLSGRRAPNRAAIAITR